MSGVAKQPGMFARAMGFAGRNRVTLIVSVIGLGLAGLLLTVLLHTARQPPVKQVPTFTIVPVTPPKPPPPPPPTPQPKMITPEKTPMPDVKPVVPNQPPKAFNLSGSGFGGLAGGGGEGGGGGSWEGYAEAKIAEALQANPITRNASAGLVVQVYFDASGAITRAVIVKSSGDPRVDQAIVDQVLPGLQLPPGAPGSPATMRLTGQSPL
jgi:hypothetical protein